MSKRTDARDRFMRVAPKRTQKVLECLDMLGKCSNLSTYEYTSDDVQQIFSAIDQQVKKIKALYVDPAAKKGFTLIESSKRLPTENMECESGKVVI